MLEIEIHSGERKPFDMEYECKEESREGWKSCFICEFRGKPLYYTETQLIQWKNGKIKYLKYSHLYLGIWTNLATSVCFDREMPIGARSSSANWKECCYLLPSHFTDWGNS